jgi:hypothetical protein
MPVENRGEIEDYFRKDEFDPKITCSYDTPENPQVLYLA